MIHDVRTGLGRTPSAWEQRWIVGPMERAAQCISSPATCAADAWTGRVAPPRAPSPIAAPQTREEMLNWSPTTLAQRNAENFLRWAKSPFPAPTGGGLEDLLKPDWSKPGAYVLIGAAALTGYVTWKAITR